MNDFSTVAFPPVWIDASCFETVLRRSHSPHGSSNVVFEFPVGSKVMIDGAVRLLSLANQLDKSTIRVRLVFDEGETGAMGYLNRMGFFDRLSPSIDVRPKRPRLSGAKVYAGNNPSLVEIAAISRREPRDATLLGRLTSAVMASCRRRSDAKELEGAAWTIFAELIDNVFVHSETDLDGYAALQVYSRGNGLKVAVSDSGLGIMETLRPPLQREQPAMARLGDVELLVEVLRQGLSRHGGDRGCGLKGSAAKAIKFKGELDVRLPSSRVLLVPSARGYRPNTAFCFADLPLIWGTHIGFTFKLDSAR